VEACGAMLHTLRDESEYNYNELRRDMCFSGRGNFTLENKEGKTGNFSVKFYPQKDFC